MPDPRQRFGGQEALRTVFARLDKVIDGVGIGRLISLQDHQFAAAWDNGGQAFEGFIRQSSQAALGRALHLRGFLRWQLVSLCGSLTRLKHDAVLDMSEEIFDVVNERDEVVGRKPRSEVHRLGLPHRAVHVLVFNRQGRVFLQKRSMQKDRQPGLWDSSASGHLNSGEDYDACAVRELAEEIGLCLAAPPLRLFKLPASPETDQEHVWIYRCEAEGPFKLHPDEIERGDWFTPVEVNRWMAERPQDFASALLAIWRKL